MKKKGSATLIVILFSTIYMLYTASTYADVRHMINTYEDYEERITEIYEQDYANVANEL